MAHTARCAPLETHLAHGLLVPAQTHLRAPGGPSADGQGYHHIILARLPDMTDTRHSAFRSIRASLRRPSAGVGFLILLLASACSSVDVGDAIDRELFIQTYVDLRVAALETETKELSGEGRAEVLARRGVIADDLVRFAEVHGRDVDFMRDVWNDVELRMDALLPDAEAR